MQVISKFQPYHRLNLELWLEWIEDERKLVGSSAAALDRAEIDKLFKRAHQDYLCMQYCTYCTLYSISRVALKLKLEIEVQLHCSQCNFKGPAVWLLWCEWQLEGPPAPGDPPEPYYARVRSAFEDALAACGLHVTLGSNLWAAYRDFETQLLHSLEVCTVMTVHSTLHSVISNLSVSPVVTTQTKHNIKLEEQTKLEIKILYTQIIKYKCVLCNCVLLLSSAAAAGRRAQRAAAEGHRQAERARRVALQAATRRPTTRYSCSLLTNKAKRSLSYIKQFGCWTGLLEELPQTNVRL